MDKVESVEQLAACVRDRTSVRVAGGGTKSALSRAANVSLAALTGVVEYNASEFTITVRAGTRLSEIEQLLATKKQYLPFDPPLIEAGATIGGTVAAGLSGSGRFRFGGVRDFLLGVKLVTGNGSCADLGSKVVKNAAGFDFPKLLVGSLGVCGIAAELTLKVFPAPEAYISVALENDTLADAMANVLRLAASQLDLACLDVDEENRLWVRIAGSAAAVGSRASRVQQFLGASGNVLRDNEDSAVWRACSEFEWAPAGHRIVKTAVAPEQVIGLAAELAPAKLRICAGGHLAWIAWPDNEAPEQLSRILERHNCTGLALTGEWPDPELGAQYGTEFLRRLRHALDPTGKFSLAQHSAA
ncbi:FAD-binding protein [Pirellulales bacterium]|nr:FAD-binding protein [Pirellulales bacterium]